MPTHFPASLLQIEGALILSHPVGRLHVPSGRLLVLDPFSIQSDKGQVISISPGDYDIIQTSIEQNGKVRSAYLSLIFSPDLLDARQRWQIRACEEDYWPAVSSDRIIDLEMPAHSLSGYVAMVDEEAYDQSLIARPQGYDLCFEPGKEGSWFDQLDASHPEVGCCLFNLPDSEANILISQRGESPGNYWLWVENDGEEDPNQVALHIDFGQTQSV